ncbi:MAG TPA: M48 family peptidase [Epsilonproteobacteria bacterium]|nr:M48 family peptidase [Campylobacterota bacterium]
MIRTLFSALLALIAFIVFTGCTTKAPVTGRNQLILMDPQQEMAIGHQGAKQILAKSKRSANPRYNAMLNRVGTRIAQASGQTNYRWEFHMIDDDKTPNAFVLPGGKVFVYTGILKYISSDDELAAVVAHEVGHALARHGAERMTKGQLVNMGGQILQVGLGARGVSAANTSAILQAFGMASQLGVILPYSRVQEYEADRIGLVLAAKAGYNPSAALTFWQKFIQADKSGQRQPEYFSTHPDPANRIAKIKELLPEVMPIYEQAKRNR